MENTSNILTIKEVAEILRCSKGHVQNVLVGKVRGVFMLAHLRMGRRKVVRKEWLDEWMETHKTGLVPSTKKFRTCR
jgi:excisionase family DNA binding protein